RQVTALAQYRAVCLFVVGDARGVADALPDREFDAVISMFTSLGYYDEETDRSILRQCRDLTRTGGIFVLETGFRDSIARNFQPHGVFRVGSMLLLHEREFDLESSRSRARWTFLEKKGRGYHLRAEVDLDHRLYSLHELIELFEQAGWRYRASYRDFEQREPSLDGNRLVVVAEHI
ncbi:MAG: class I SAM-dependent methyltransferase, partial [Dehalococcoidia bacterium]